LPQQVLQQVLQQVPAPPYPDYTILYPGPELRQFFFGGGLPLELEAPHAVEIKESTGEGIFTLN
jgi:hypothetical protein